MSKRITLELAFGQVLREARMKTGLSQERLALETEMDRSYISLLERGLRQPSLRTIFTLAGKLDLLPSVMISKVERRLKQ